MVLGPPVGDQFGEAGEGVKAALQMHAVPGRSAAWLIVDVRDLAALHAALAQPGHGPRRYTAGGHRVSVSELATMLRQIADTPVVAVPIPDTALRVAGAGIGTATIGVSAAWPSMSASSAAATRWPPAV